MAPSVNRALFDFLTTKPRRCEPYLDDLLNEVVEDGNWTRLPDVAAWLCDNSRADDGARVMWWTTVEGLRRARRPPPLWKGRWPKSWPRSRQFLPRVLVLDQVRGMFPGWRGRREGNGVDAINAFTR